MLALAPASARPIVGLWEVDDGFARIAITSDAKGTIDAQVFLGKNGVDTSPIGVSWRRGSFAVDYAPPTAGLRQTISFNPKGADVVVGTFESVTEDIWGPNRHERKDADAKVRVRRLCP